jgi:MFS family permease
MLTAGGGTGARFLEILVHALTVPSPVAFPDFFLACSSRALFNAGLACQNYMIFFFRDYVRSAQPPEQVVSRLAVLALLGGLVGAVPAGVLSDRFGRKPVIFFSAIVCVAAMMSFPFLSSRTAFDLVGLVFGLGNVAYLSVDYALGVQALPRKLAADGARRPIDAAKDLGVFALSATVGMLIGQLVFAGVLERFSRVEVGRGGVPESHYAAAGFVVVFAVSSLFFVLSACAAAAIKTLR